MVELYVGQRSVVGAAMRRWRRPLPTATLVTQGTELKRFAFLIFTISLFADVEPTNAAVANPAAIRMGNCKAWGRHFLREIWEKFLNTTISNQQQVPNNFLIYGILIFNVITSKVVFCLQFKTFIYPNGVCLNLRPRENKLHNHAETA